MPNRLREYQRPTDLSAALNLLRRTDVQSAPVLVGPRPPAACLDVGRPGRWSPSRERLALRRDAEGVFLLRV